MARPEYQITQFGDDFIVTDSNQDLVGIFDTELIAQAEIVREQWVDVIWERTQELIRYAVVTVQKEFGVSQEIALYWVNSALGLTESGMDGEARS